MRTNPHKKVAKPTYSIIVDGETEIWYFQLLKQHEHLSVDIKPELPKKKSLFDQFNTVVDNARHYDKVFCTTSGFARRYSMTSRAFSLSAKSSGVSLEKLITSASVASSAASWCRYQTVPAKATSPQASRSATVLGG